ncbi:FecR family protein [Spirosoma arcticum]
MSNHYPNFTSRDFVLDDAFRRWVLQPNEQSMTFWHTFMLNHPAQQATVDEAASLLLHLRANYDNLTEASQVRIGQVLKQAALEQQIETPVLPLTARRGTHVWRMAASLTGALLIMGGAVWYGLRSGQQRIHTAFGENRSVTLPDGSTVLLNGNSTLTFATNWDDVNREVWLDGEGYFKVAKRRHTSGRTGVPVKFVTHTPTLDITVLGTQFNVNTRRGGTAVMLVEGRVQLAKPGQLRPGRIIEMKPGQLASTLPNIEKVVVQTEKPQLHTSWTQHEFVFENTALTDIAQQLRDTYGVNLIVEDTELANRRFTGNLSNQSIETLLTTLAITFDLSVRHDGDRIVLQRNPQ